MRISKINIAEPLRYFKSGQFQASDGWKHKRMCLDGDYEIILGLHGEVFLTVDGSPCVIRPGEIFVIPPYITYEGYKASDDHTRFYWLHFFPRLGVFRCTDLQMTADYSREPEKGKTKEDIRSAVFYAYLPLHFSALHPEKLYILMNQILDVAHSSYSSSYCIDYLVTSLALEISEQYGQYHRIHNEQQSESNKRFSQILEWIRINIYKEITVQDIADHFALNPDYLTRLFKKHLDMGTKKYVNIQKINAAKGLLASTDMSTKEIAYILNYKDEKYLMRLFKNIEGITIAQYRNAYTHTYLNNIQVDPDIPIPEGPL